MFWSSSCVSNEEGAFSLRNNFCSCLLHFGYRSTSLIFQGLANQSCAIWRSACAKPAPRASSPCACCNHHPEESTTLDLARRLLFPVCNAILRLNRRSH